MRCDELQLKISLYDGDALSTAERGQLDVHLQTCPLCRLRLANTRELVRDLSSLARPEIPIDIRESIRTSMAAELGAGSITGTTPTIPRRPWINKWLVPSALGGLASVAIGLTVLGSIFLTGITGPTPTQPVRTVFLPSGQVGGDDSSTSGLTPTQYAKTRLDVSSESPSINPNGALVALTKSLVRGEMKDDEVVVVAEVLGNGLARVDEVIEPSRDRRAVYELQKAFQSDPSYAPFVPARVDGRSESVRVVLRIQNIDVDTRLPHNGKL